MLVIFLSFVSSVIMVRSELIKINKTQLKDQLQKSLTHVNEMLADIEHQIESERKKISQIDYDLNYKETPPGFMDYVVTDMWWPTNKSLTHTHLTHSSHRPPSSFFPGDFTQTSPAIPTAIDDIATNISTTDAQPTNESQTKDPNLGWPFENTPHPGVTQFVQELLIAMEADKFGYFTVGLTKFLELVAIKDTKNIAPIIDGMKATVGRLLQEEILFAFGQSLQGNIGVLMEKMKNLAPEKLQRKAGVGNYILKHKYSLASTHVNGCLELYDSAFEPSEGVELFGALEEFNRYPDGGQKAIEVSRDLLRAALVPFLRLTPEHQATLVSCTNHAIEAMNPDLRAGKNESENNSSSIITKHGTILTSVNTNETSALFTNITGDLLAGLPSRRHMRHGSKKFMRHFFKKHHKLFKRLDEHHKYSKRKKHHSHHKVHHHTYHKKHKKHHNKKHVQRAHDDQHDSHEKHDSHDKHDPHDKQDSPDKEASDEQREQLKQYMQFKQTYRKMGLLGLDTNADEEKVDTSGSDAYFQATKRKHKPKSEVRNITQDRIETARKLFGTIDKQYLTKLANKFKAKMENQNYRRFIVTSSENKSFENSENSTINENVIKIREASSYSDEEYHLRTNLYDALRHGNRTFVYLHNYTVPALSGDEELIIKSNLYKVL